MWSWVTRGMSLWIWEGIAPTTRGMAGFWKKRDTSPAVIEGRERTVPSCFLLQRKHLIPTHPTSFMTNACTWALFYTLSSALLVGSVFNEPLLYFSHMKRTTTKKPLLISHSSSSLLFAAKLLKILVQPAMQRRACIVLTSRHWEGRAAVFEACHHFC